MTRNVDSREPWLRRRFEGNERMHQHDAVEQFRRGEDRRGEDVRAIGIADPVDLGARIQRAVRAHEARHLRGALGEVLHIVDAFAGAAEEAIGAMLGNVAARRDNPGIGQYLLCEAGNPMFVVICAVKAKISGVRPCVLA